MGSRRHLLRAPCKIWRKEYTGGKTTTYTKSRYLNETLAFTKATEEKPRALLQQRERSVPRQPSRQQRTMSEETENAPMHTAAPVALRIVPVRPPRKRLWEERKQRRATRMIQREKLPWGAEGAHGPPRGAAPPGRARGTTAVVEP